MVKPCTLAWYFHASYFRVFDKGRVGLVDKHGVVLELVFVQYHGVAYIDNGVDGYHAVIAVVECGVVLKPCGKDCIVYYHDAVAYG